MRKLAIVATLVGGVLATSAARAQTFSTSVLNPTPVPTGGVISGSYPPSAGETSYYFATDLKAGELATQISFMGRSGRDKSLELTLLDPSGKRAGSHYIMGSLDSNAEQARVLPVDASGRHVIRVTLKGPEATTFRVELGGGALGGKPSGVNGAANFSRSFLLPSALPAEGMVVGKFPMTESGVTTYYYYGVDLRAGQLLSQLSFAGRNNVDKFVDFSVLNAQGRSVGGYYIMSGLDANQEATKSIVIDRSAAYVLRVGVKGPESTSFKLELGGNALAGQ